MALWLVRAKTASLLVLCSQSMGVPVSFSIKPFPLCPAACTSNSNSRSVPAPLRYFLLLLQPVPTCGSSLLEQLPPSPDLLYQFFLLLQPVPTCGSSCAPTARCMSCSPRGACSAASPRRCPGGWVGGWVGSCGVVLGGCAGDSGFREGDGRRQESGRRAGSIVNRTYFWPGMCQASK